MKTKYERSNLMRKKQTEKSFEGKSIFENIFGFMKSIVFAILFIIFIFFIWLFFDENWAMLWLFIGVIYFIIQKFVFRD